MNSAPFHARLAKPLRRQAARAGKDGELGEHQEDALHVVRQLAQGIGKDTGKGQRPAVMAEVDPATRAARWP